MCVKIHVSVVPYKAAAFRSFGREALRIKACHSESSQRFRSRTATSFRAACCVPSFAPELAACTWNLGIAVGQDCSLAGQLVWVLC